LFVTEIFHLREQWKGPPLQVQNTEVSVISIRIRTSGSVIGRLVAFSDLSVGFSLMRKASTMSNSANIVLGLQIQRRWHYESGWQVSTLCGCSFTVHFWR